MAFDLPTLVGLLMVLVCGERSGVGDVEGRAREYTGRAQRWGFGPSGEFRTAPLAFARGVRAAV